MGTSTNHDGGPAYPTDSERQNGHDSYHFAGMTLRDHFAGLAMQSIAISYPREVKSSDEVATDAYEMADAMLKERAK